MGYVDPKTVVSPKRAIKSVTVLYDGGEVDGEHAGFSVARLNWYDDPETLGIRWNGGAKSSLGTPHSMGQPTWFIVPEGLRESVLKWVENQQGSSAAELLSGYRSMAADAEREEEARQWSEGLIGDATKG